MYSHPKSNNSSSVILPAIISIIIMEVVICTGYKFKNRKMFLIPRFIIGYNNYLCPTDPLEHGIRVCYSINTVQ
jgi:hypothetical protein